MMKKLLFGLVLVLTLVSIACADQPVRPDTPRGLAIVSVGPVKDEIYAAVSIEFPKAWTNPQFTWEVNGKPARMRQRSGGFSEDRNMADFLFIPGKTEKQSVTVKTVIDGKRVDAKSSFDWKPTPFIAVIGHTGDREIVMAREKLTVAAANVTDVKLFFNGKEVHPRPSAGDIQTLSFDPAWRKGKNVLTVNADKLDGGIIAKNFTFFDLGDGGVLPLGQTAVLQYGQEGSKSGPFYDVRIEGDAIAAVRDARVRRSLIDKDGWIVSEVWLARELRAQKEGMAKVRVFVKPHFLQKMELEKEFSITVADR
ncbi:MAG: hypothetical protein KA801_00205 [Syntrophorhabdaceae bacterium]|nr:hypothetical protein [Syntrophorhabdaceae bacterium]